MESSGWPYGFSCIFVLVSIVPASLEVVAHESVKVYIVLVIIIVIIIVVIIIVFVIVVDLDVLIVGLVIVLVDNVGPRDCLSTEHREGWVLGLVGKIDDRCFITSLALTTMRYFAL
jgi:hypothetical protein